MHDIDSTDISIREQQAIADYGKDARYPVCQAAINLWKLDASMAEYAEQIQELGELQSGISDQLRQVAHCRRHVSWEPPYKEVHECTALIGELEKQDDRAEKAYWANARMLSAKLSNWRPVAVARFRRELDEASHQNNTAAIKALGQVKKRFLLGVNQPSAKSRVLSALRKLSSFRKWAETRTAWDRRRKEAWRKDETAWLKAQSAKIAALEKEKPQTWEESYREWKDQIEAARRAVYPGPDMSGPGGFAGYADSLTAGYWEITTNGNRPASSFSFLVTAVELAAKAGVSLLQACRITEVVGVWLLKGKASRTKASEGDKQPVGRPSKVELSFYSSTDIPQAGVVRREIRGEARNTKRHIEETQALEAPITEAEIIVTEESAYRSKPKYHKEFEPGQEFEDLQYETTTKSITEIQTEKERKGEIVDEPTTTKAGTKTEQPEEKIQGRSPKFCKWMKSLGCVEWRRKQTLDRNARD